MVDEGIIAEIVEWSQNSSRVSNLAFKNDGKDESALVIPYCKNFGVGWGQQSKIAGTPGRSAWSDDEDEIIENRNGLDDEDLTSENKYNPTISTDISQMLRDLENAKINK